MTEPKEACPGCEHFSESEKLHEELRQRDLQIDGLKKELGETQSAAIKWKENSDILERICTESGKLRTESDRFNEELKKKMEAIIGWCHDGYGDHTTINHIFDVAKSALVDKRKEEVGVFCLDHRKVMTNGICPKCGP